MEAIEAGELELEDSEEEAIDYSELSLKELRALCDEKEIEYDKKDKKEDLIALLEAASDEDSVEIEDADERDEAIIEAEAEVEEDIRKQFTAGKLKQSQIKSFLKDYYDGDAECSDCGKCSKDEQLTCYINIHKALVDDDGEKHDMEDAYVREGEDFCCGKPLQNIDGKDLCCAVCGSVYGE